MNPRTTEVGRGREVRSKLALDNLPNNPEAVWQTDFEVRQDEESSSYMAKVRDKNVTVRNPPWSCLVEAVGLLRDRNVPEN